MNMVYMLLALYERPYLNFQETCDAIGISKQTGYNLRNNKKFPIAMLESPLRADVRDVAAYIDEQREKVKRHN